ncbi:Predicted Zn-dependent peptidase [Flexibacter flexilis DSM 6793]|uniref:Predicted Zn-dependent peptidase n=2 Tax=Flexibacter flexilis TaxID=998 RepID=A0A1I1N2B9_9BACT|nr:Predicted Zn-dependent peptidase [Flexibacter flexilis DSM 6793]
MAMLLFTAQQSLWAQSFKLPAYQKTKLKNGLTVYLMEQHEVPMVNVSVAVTAGSVKDGNRYGLAALTADALLFGTKKYSKEQIEEKLEFVGAELATGAGKEASEISASFAKKDQALVLDMLHDVLVNPVFDAQEFDKHKTRLVAQLKQQKESPREVIGSYYNAFMYGSHPYGTPVTGSEGTVSKITVQDVKQFYGKEYAPTETAIAVVGDFSAKAMLKEITALFGTWQPSSQPTKLNLGTPNLDFTESRILLVNKDDARETTFRIGGKGVTRNNSDYVGIQVINTILGGRFTSWLNDALRVNSGLTYGANSRFDRLKYAGTFQISTFTKNSTTIEAIDMALDVLDSLHKHGVNQEILNSAKNYVKGNYPPTYETSGALADLLTEMYIYGFDESVINNFQRDVDAITPERAKEIIAKYFPKNNLQFVLTGKGSEIREKVKKYGKYSEKDIKTDGF